MIILWRYNWAAEPLVSYFIQGDVRVSLVELSSSSYIVRTLDKLFITAKPAWVSHQIGTREAQLFLKLSICSNLQQEKAFWKRLYFLEKEKALKALVERVEDEYILERLKGKRNEN